MYSFLKRKLADFIQWQTTLGSGSLEIRKQIAELSEQMTAMRRQLLSLQNRPDNFLRLYSSDREELRQRLMTLQELVLQQTEEARQHLGEFSGTMKALGEVRQALIDRQSIVGQVPSDFRQLLERLQIAISQLAETPQKYAYIGDHLGIGTAIFGHRLFIDTRDRQIAPHLATRGLWEPWNGRVFQALLREGDTVVDVSSNVGYFVMLSAQLVGPTGHVIAVEANPAIAGLGLGIGRRIGRLAALRRNLR